SFVSKSATLKATRSDGLSPLALCSSVKGSYLPSAKTTSLGYGSPRNTTTSLSPSSASLSQVLLPWSCRFAISSVRSHMLVGAIGLRLLLGVGVAVVLAPVHGEELGAVG